ncbi:MAG: dTDP-glucose 4,6-dehydratase, partial [Rickettsiales bacterium]|nr:dTDP-glucose 4,6-dehydratase [Rickettsiales bacterium]
MNDTQTILITGGAGFIGSALVAEATKRGYRVIVLDKLTYAGHRVNLEGIAGDHQLVIGDVADATRVAGLFKKFPISGVIHAAAESHVDNSIAGSAAFMQANIIGTHVLLEAAREAFKGDAAKRFLQVSTDEVYGALGDEGEFTLDTPMKPNSPYAASKAAADMLVRSWHVTYGLNTVITRCCNNYGPRQHPEKLIPRMITNALACEKLPVYGQGQQRREWIHVEDHACGVMDAFTRGRSGHVYHLGSGEERRNITLVQSLCETLARKLPGRDYHALITYVEDRLGHDYRYALDVSSATSIGFKPRIAFRDGMEATIDWYIANAE